MAWAALLPGHLWLTLAPMILELEQSGVARLTIMKSSVSVCSGVSQCFQAWVEGKAAKRTENVSSALFCLYRNSWDRDDNKLTDMFLL